MSRSENSRKYWSIRDYCGFSALVVLAESNPLKLTEHSQRPKGVGNTCLTPRMGHQHQRPGHSAATPWVTEKTWFAALKGQYVELILPFQPFWAKGFGVRVPRDINRRQNRMGPITLLGLEISGGLDAFWRSRVVARIRWCVGSNDYGSQNRNPIRL